MNETEKNEFEIMQIDDQIVKIRRPMNYPGNRVYLMLHGHTGDENSMQVFTRNLPTNAWIFSPRGFYPTDEGGYKWISSLAGLTASITEFQIAVRKLNAVFSEIKGSLGVPETPVDVIGFSQGAVMALTYAITFPESIHRAACLSGFLPSDTLEIVAGRPLHQIPIFVAHGTKDETVKIDRARDAVDWLTQLGASVSTCEAPVTHRISANCFRGFSEFFS